LALLQQSKQGENGFSGELCAESRRMVSGQIGGSDRDAQAYAIAIGHEDMTGTLGRMTDREDDESSSEQGMSRFRHLDLVESLIRWVLEPGILLLSRLIGLAIAGWKPIFLWTRRSSTVG
jgi:hypothetical protein